MMDRREMLKGSVGAVGVAGAGLVGEGCAHQGAPLAGPAAVEPLPDQAVIDHIAGSMDRRLDWIDRQQLPSDLVQAPGRPLTSERQAYAERCGLLFRQSMRTLYVTGRFMDLPDEIKMHPHIQARVAAAQPEMDDAVLGTTALLESLTPEDHRMIQATLRARPEVGERLATLLDTTAQADGIPFKRRMSVRTSTLQLADRMSSQAPALTIDPYVRRVRKLAAQPHPENRTARLLAARMGEEAFWQHQQRLAELSSRWDRQLAQGGAAAAPAAVPAPGAASRPPARQASDPELAPRPKHGPSVLTIGGYTMGFGAGSVGVGLLFAGLHSAYATDAFLWPALIFGVTVGPILLIVGLVIVIVGAIMLASDH